MGQTQGERREHATEQTLYEMCGPWAKKFKIGLQFLIGIGLALLLLAKTFVAVSFLGTTIVQTDPLGLSCAPDSTASCPADSSVSGQSFGVFSRFS